VGVKCSPIVIASTACGAWQSRHPSSFPHFCLSFPRFLMSFPRSFYVIPAKAGIHLLRHCETYILSRGNFISLYHIIANLSHKFILCIFFLTTIPSCISIPHLVFITHYLSLYFIFGTFLSFFVLTRYYILDTQYCFYTVLYIFSITFKNPSFFEKYFKNI